MFRRLVLLALLVLARPAPVRAEAVSTESLVRRADAVVEARVVVRERREAGKAVRYPALEVLDVLDGEPPDEIPLVLSDAFEPEPGEEALWFLARGPRGWVPLGVDPFRPLPQGDWIRALLEVRQDPRRVVGGASQADPLRLKAALALLQPRTGDRLALVGLLGHAEWPVRLAAARALGRLDRDAALRWLFPRWSAEDPARFQEVRTAVEGLLRRQVPVPVEQVPERRRAVELYRVAWELEGPDRARALARLPELRRAVAVEAGPWALETLALYPRDLALPGLADALRNPDESGVGRALALLREALSQRDPAVLRVAAGSTGSLLRNRLQALARRTWSDPEVGRQVASEARELLERLRDLAGQDPAAGSP